MDMCIGQRQRHADNAASLVSEAWDVLELSVLAAGEKLQATVTAGAIRGHGGPVRRRRQIGSQAFLEEELRHRQTLRPAVEQPEVPEVWG